jgi:homoserine kinase
MRKNIDINTHSGVKVFAPASVANVACGYDVLGFALEKPGDEIIVKYSDIPGLRITKITGTTKKLPLEVEGNTAGVAGLRLLEALGETEIGIEMEIHKKMPFGSGLGSSAASAVGGAMAVNELLGRPFDKKELLPFAVLGESVASGAIHADNVAPSLLGGFTLVRDSHTYDVARLNVPRGLCAVVVYPHVEILTADARAILSPNVSLKNMVQQSANLGALIIGLYNSDFDLIRRSLKDVVIEPQRSKLIPHFYDVQNIALSEGALGCSISGSGPSIFALCDNSFTAEKVGAAMMSIFAAHKIQSELYISPINQEGVRVM